MKRNRWGDYSGIAPDPADTNSVWVAGEYASATNVWATWIGLVTFQTLQNVPDIDVTPKDQIGNPALNFGSVGIFQAKTLQFTISNTGNANLMITGISKPASPFKLVKPPTVPFTLSPGTSRTVKVKFKPTSAKTYIGTITITSNDPDEPAVTVNLSGTGM
jgi:hypothetical protein